MASRDDRRTPSTALSLAGLAVLVAWAGTALALAVAGGATRVGGADSSSYDTEFIQEGVYLGAAVVATVILGAAAVRRWVPAALGLAGSVAGLLWGAVETVHRYRESGWGDGLEVFIFIVPIGTALLGGVVVTVVHLLARTKRDAAPRA